jgi:hypothetical protein
MAWLDRLNADPALSPPARMLATIIAEKFATLSVRYASYRDVDAASALSITVETARSARLELMRLGYLVPLQYARTPSFSLRSGYPTETDADVA